MKSFSVLLLGLWLLTGCSATTISGAWKDPQYAGGKLQNVLVVGIAQQDLMQRLYEDSFVRELGKSGVRGAASYTILPEGEPHSVASIRQQVANRGFGFLLITRVADRRTVEITHPGTAYIESHYYDRGPYYTHYPYYRHWYDYYDRSFTTIQTLPPYTTQAQLVILETNVYETRSGEIIYSVQTETLTDYGAARTIREVVDAIIGNLRDNRLL